MADDKTKHNYDESKVKTLSSIEHIRLRTGMYIGRIGTGAHYDDGCYILLKEVIDNAIDEFIMGHGKHVEISVEGNNLAGLGRRGGGRCCRRVFLGHVRGRRGGGRLLGLRPRARASLLGRLASDRRRRNGASFESGGHRSASAIHRGGEIAAAGRSL